jgi:hypothetical protein
MPWNPRIWPDHVSTCLTVSHSGGVRVSATASANCEQPSLTPRLYCVCRRQSVPAPVPTIVVTPIPAPAPVPTISEPVATPIPAPALVPTISEPVVTTLIHQLKGLNDNDILMSEPIRGRLRKSTDPGVVAIMADLASRWNAAGRGATTNWSTADATEKCTHHHARVVRARWQLPSSTIETLMTAGCWRYSGTPSGQVSAFTGPAAKPPPASPITPPQPTTAQPTWTFHNGDTDVLDHEAQVEPTIPQPTAAPKAKPATVTITKAGTVTPNVLLVASQDCLDVCAVRTGQDVNRRVEETGDRQQRDSEKAGRSKHNANRPMAKYPARRSDASR